MATHHIAVIPGDGIGQEVMPEGIKALRAVQDTVTGLHLD
ncbi:MAG: tartrate dehydrogenase, partial [Candidatus Tectomicrobia bacterium]|nr:tartrate dehydrogenase [Candidatus Tectomicrobia bacterium]